MSENKQQTVQDIRAELDEVSSWQAALDVENQKSEYCRIAYLLLARLESLTQQTIETEGQLARVNRLYADLVQDIRNLGTFKK